MNYLAHAYLSFNEPSLLVGNMISDFVKGAAKSGYPVSIQHGIVLHRAIDAYTDAHPITAKAKHFFRSDYRLYSGPLVDIIYDHFLATDTTLFTEESLYQFTREVYQTLENETTHLPPVFINVLAYMKGENWLYHYRTTEGIQKSLRGLIRRAAFIHDSTKAIEILLHHYDELKECYQQFFPDVKQMAKQKMTELLA